MTESELEYCSNIKYKVVPRKNYYVLVNKILDVDIFIYHDEEYPILTARLDWQDGLHIWQSENIDPFAWSAISKQLLLAMKEAKSLIDPEKYCAGDPA